MRSTQLEALHTPASLKRLHEPEPAHRYESPPLSISLFCDRNWPKGGAGITFTAGLSRQVEVERMALPEASIWRPFFPASFSPCLAERKIARNGYATSQPAFDLSYASLRPAQTLALERRILT